MNAEDFLILWYNKNIKGDNGMGQVKLLYMGNVSLRVETEDNKVIYIDPLK